MADHKPLYRWSLQDAVTHNEVQDWRDSYRENCDCARAIERAIADQYHDNILENGTKDIIDRYGFDRVNWVLANTLQEKAHDGRFSQDNKRWAKGFFIPSDDVRWHFCVESHPGLTDLFINQTREAWQKLGLFDASHCSEDNDYAGKLLILKPSVLKDEFKASDYQLFYAESGFGCSPTASGRKVFGKFLKDGENTSFNRSDFLGVIKDECIPEWAAEKLAELEPPDEDESESDGVINLFSDVNTEFSLFDPKFLEEISKMKEKNLAVELLKKLIAEQVSIYRRTNVVKSEKFSEIMQRAMNSYLNGMLTNEQVIEEMMKLAKQIAAAQKEGEKLGLTADELAFYDALTKPQAIKDFYENEELIAITKELAETLRKNRTIDWQKRDSARAKMRMMIKKLLKKHKYPPEGMDDAVQTVMTQCELWTDNADFF